MLVGPTPDDRIDWAVVDPWANATILYDEDGAPSGLDGTVRRNFNGEQKSKMTNTGLFFLSDISFGKLNLLIGGRYDQFDVDSRDDALALLGIPYDTRGTLSMTTMQLAITSAFHTAPIWPASVHYGRRVICLSTINRWNQPGASPI